MLKTRIALALSPIVMALLVGCSNHDPRFTPAEAPEIDNTIAVNNLWSASTRGVGDYYSELIPAFSGSSMFFASRKGEVVAFSLSDGDRVWRTYLDDEAENDDKSSARLSGGVTVHGNRVVVGSENGYVYALDGGSGAISWKSNLKAEVVARPVFNAAGDRLFVLDSRGNFSALDSATGRVLWVTGDAPSALRLRAQAAPVTVGDEYVLVGTASGRINVLRQDTGSVVNVIDVGSASGRNDFERLSDIAAAPLLIGNSLYASSFAGGLVQYDFGSYGYKARLGYSTSKDMAFDDESIVLTADDGTVFCLNRADNSQRWANNQLRNRQVSAPAIYGNHVVVGDFEGNVYFMDLTDGSIDYMDEIDGDAIRATPQVYQGRLFVTSSDGDVYCLSYPDNRAAVQKEASINTAIRTAARGISLNAPGVEDSGIYVPNAISPEDLEARRDAIRKAVARQDAQMAAQRRAYERALKERAEYEARIKAYEEERRQKLSGFGIASDVSDEDQSDAVEHEDQSAESSAPAESASGSSERSGSSSFGIGAEEEIREEENRKAASGFGI